MAQGGGGGGQQMTLNSARAQMKEKMAPLV